MAAVKDGWRGKGGDAVELYECCGYKPDFAEHR